MKKLTKVGVAGSIIWLILAFVIMQSTKTYVSDRFPLEGFLLLGVLPVAAFWGYLFFKEASD